MMKTQKNVQEASCMMKSQKNMQDASCTMKSQNTVQDASCTTDIPKFDLHFTYKLTYQEAYDTFYLLASRQSKRTKTLLGICLTAVAVCLLILFAADSRGIHYLFLAVIAILLLFYLLYHPLLSARKGAKNVAKTNGTYKITVNESGRIQLPGNQTLQFGEDKYARAVETDSIFALRIDTQHTLCIPKRILKEREILQIRQMIEHHTRK